MNCVNMDHRKTRKHLTLKDKCDIIKLVESGSSVTSLARSYGIAKSTVCSIKNKRDVINVQASKMSFIGNRRTLKKGELPRMEELLYKWFVKQRSRNAPITGGMMRSKAKRIYKQLTNNSSGFNASAGWLGKFKKRHGIRFLKISGEKLSSQPELVAPFKECLAKKMRDLGLNKDQIYNADESGLFYKSLPEKTFVLNSEKTASGMKISKQRLTFLVCTNASGTHKLKPLVIGKAANPRCFRNFRVPLEYRHSKKAWMTMVIFKNWFYTVFTPEVRKFLGSRNLPQKALLILDNAPCHPPKEELCSEDGLISVIYMPPNVTPLIQPMDQNIIRITKLHYRTALLASVLSKDEDLVKAIKDITVKDAVINLFAAWTKLDQTTIWKCWRNILEDNEFDDEDDIPLKVLQENIQKETHNHVEEVLTLLNSSKSNVYEAQDVIEWNRDEECNSDDVYGDSDDECVEVPNTRTVSNQSALEGINASIDWAEANKISLEEQVVLRRLREKIFCKISEQKKKQTSLTKYFSKQ